MDADRRRGFTLVELLVVIAIIGLLSLLLVPHHGGRERSRLTLCSYNATQLARAMVSREIRAKSFPGYLLAISAGATETPEPNNVVAWPALLLRELDQIAMWDEIVLGQQDLERPHRLDVFICPSDPSVTITPQEYAALSYVVNSGMPDLPEPDQTTPSDLKANGVCHDLRPGAFGPKVRSSDIRDGSARTILISENVQRDYPEELDQRGNTWLRPIPGAKNVEQWYGMTWVYDAKDPLHPAAELFAPFDDVKWPATANGQPYADERSRLARPASRHMGGIFVTAFCDGNVRVVSDDIDYRVYQQFMTPNGEKATLADSPETDLDVLLDPPLSDEDY